MKLVLMGFLKLKEGYGNMEIIQLYYDQVANVDSEYVAAIGNFDGIHIGHREIIKRAEKISRDMNLKLAVITFDISPKKIVNNIENYSLLRSFDQKKEILKDLKVETIFLTHFNKKFQSLSAEQFVEKMIIKNNIKFLICGFDFFFGANKSGDIHFLSKYKEFKTIVVPRVDYNNHKIGSTYIHELISLGKIEEANIMLEKPYSIIGNVIHGRAKGHLIGFPTANIMPIINYRVPATGVYATYIIVKNKKYLSMTNVGNNPTFNFTNVTSIETHIFDFDEEIYDEEVELIFIEYMRNEKIFEDMSELINQLSRDKQDILNKYGDVNAKK